MFQECAYCTYIAEGDCRVCQLPFCCEHGADLDICLDCRFAMIITFDDDVEFLAAVSA